MQQLVQRRDISLRHLQSLELAQLSVVAQTRYHVPQPVERVVQTVHPSSFPRVRGQPPLPQHLYTRRRPVFHPVVMHALPRLFTGRVLDLPLVPGRVALPALPLALLDNVALVPLCMGRVRATQINYVAPLPVTVLPAIIPSQKTITFRDPEEALLLALPDEIAPVVPQRIRVALMMMMLLLVHFWRHVLFTILTGG